MKKLCLIALACVSVFGQKVDYVHQMANKPVFDMRQYQFAYLPATGLAIGNTTVTFPVVPQGVNGSDVGHYLYASGGTGTAEACQIVGGSGTAGQANGQIVLNCANAHSGAFSIQSSTAGIQEAVNSLPAGGGQVFVPAGTWTIYSAIIINNSYVTVQGANRGSTVLTTAQAILPCFSLPNAAAQQDVISDMQLTGPNAGSQFAISAPNGAPILGLYRLTIVNWPQGIMGAGLNMQNWMVEDVKMTGITGDGVQINTLTDGGTYTNVFIVGASNTSVGFHILAAVGGRFMNCETLSVAYGYYINPPSGSVVGTIYIFDPNIGGFSTNSNGGAGMRITAVAGSSVNTIYADGGGFGGFGRGVLIDGTGPVQDLVFNGAYNVSNQFEGWDIINPKASNIFLTDCFAEANSLASSGTYNGLTILGASGTGNQIAGPIFVKGGVYGAGSFDNGFNSQGYGIYLQYANHVRITDISATPNITGAFLNAGGNTDTLVERVYGYNPVGVQTITPTPASGSTTFTYTAGSSPETVYIQGGTITSVTRGGKLIANASPPGGTSYIIPLAPNTAVTLIYTATPSQMFTDIQ